MNKLLLAILAATAAYAQTAQITGRVTDASGAVAPGTNITVRNVGTGIDRRVATNVDGYYAVPLLSPGEYRVTVANKGFKPIVRSGVVLEVDQRAELDFTLQVGAIAEQIEVNAAVTRLNTVDGSQGQVIENQRIVEMPLNGRNYEDLALASPGAVQALNGARYEGFSSGGMRDTQNNFILDGVDNNAVELAGAQRRSEMVQPSIDAIQEFKVQTNSYAAEYGRAMGSVVNVTTKSGTNDLHGTAFEFLRNEKLDAKNFFDPVDKPKPPFKRNQYGFAVGGPVYIPKLFNGRNRVFFFTDYEGTKIRVSNTNTSTLPTPLMRTGDFSELLTLRRPAVALTDPATGNPLPGNIIPASRIDPVAKTLINLYPLPQVPGVASNFVYQSPAAQDVSKFDVRADVNLGTKDNVSWRISKHDSTIPAPLVLPPPAYGNGAFDSAITGINTGANWNHIFTPNIIMSVRGAWNYGLFTRDNPAQTHGEFLNVKYGIKGGTDTFPGGFAAMTLTGYAAIGIGASNPVNRDSQNRQLAGDVSWAKGRHAFKFGASLLRSQNNILNARNEVGGPYQFNGRYTKDGAADFLLGLASQYTWSTRLQVNLRSWNTGFFAQDDWKVTPNLTLNLGVRYEVVLPFIDKQDRMGTFDDWTNPAKPRLIFAGSDGKDRYNRAMFATDKNNIMPRVGFAYKLGSNGVVRGGYGIFYGYMEPYGDAEYLIGNPPYAFGVTLASSPTVPAVILQQGPLPGSLELTKATGLTFAAYERAANMGYAQQWNFDLQREIGHEALLEVGYVGSKGTHILKRYDDNFSPPGPGNVNDKRPYRSIEIPGTGVVSSPLGPVYAYHNNGNSNYHGLIAKFEKRFSKGFTLLTSYSFSKAIGDTCGNSASGNTTDCGFQDLRNMRAERSVDNQDVPRRLAISGVYELPFGRGRHFASGMPAIANAVFGGWSVGSIAVHSSGRPYNLSVAGNPANSGTFDNVNRPNVVGDPGAVTRTVERDFNTDAFSPNRQFQIGNAGRNILRQRSFFNWDFSSLKNFQIREKIRLQFRFEAFHFTNTPRFGQAGGVLGTATFGRITSADTPRNLQFGMKLIW
jgi:outer membrane receptor protein involved in Fe transport